MSAISYVGAAPVDDNDLVNDKAVADAVTASNAVSKSAVDSAISTAVTTLATLDTVTAKDKNFASITDYQVRDLVRNVPTTPVNAPNAPVTLQQDGTIPASRFPLMGGGYLRGPFGFYQVSSGSGVSTTKAAVATFVSDAIPSTAQFRPMCFANVLLRSSNTGGFPVVEIRLGSDSSGPLLAVGRGRSMYTGLQSVPVLPVGDSSGWWASNGGQVGATVWVYDAVGTATVAVESVSDVTGAMFILQSPMV